MQIQDTWVKIMAVDIYLSMCINVKNSDDYYHKNNSRKTYGNNGRSGYKAFNRVDNYIKRK